MTCGCTDEALGVYSKAYDNDDGSYLLEWWAAAGTGIHEIYIKIHGIHVIGSPALMQLTSAPPDVSKTEIVVKNGAIIKAVAGARTTVRIRCKDARGNPALPTPNRRFGVSLVPTREKDRNAWHRAPTHRMEATIVGSEGTLG